jgi:hypothetical protein
MHLEEIAVFRQSDFAFVFNRLNRLGFDIASESSGGFSSVWVDSQSWTAVLTHIQDDPELACKLVASKDSTGRWVWNGRE